MSNSIFDNFRRNQHKLNQRPSSDAWSKLESRLDADRRPLRTVFSIYRQWMVAASVALVAGLFFVLGRQTATPKVAMAQPYDLPVPRSVEDLPQEVNLYETNSGSVAEYRRLVNASPSGIIKEGGFHKKLVAQDRPMATLNAPQSVSTTRAIDVMTFSWLLGEWTALVDDGFSTEKWVATEPHQLEGSGYFEQNGQMVFSEKMILSAEEGQIYFKTQILPEGKLIKFILTDYQNHQAVFTNKDMVFPTHIILTRNAKDAFSIIFQNDTATVADQTNQSYLNNQRNLVTPQRVERTLQRHI